MNISKLMNILYCLTNFALTDTVFALIRYIWDILEKIMGEFLKAYANCMVEYPGLCLLYTFGAIFLVFWTFYVIKVVFSDDDDARQAGRCRKLIFKVTINKKSEE